jgi:hypothetical protein
MTNQLPESVLRLIDTLASEWGLKPQLLASEILSHPDIEEIERRIELLETLANRIRTIDEVSGTTDTGRSLWETPPVGFSSSPLKCLLGVRHPDSVLDIADDMAFQLEGFVEGISVPGVSFTQSLSETLELVLVPRTHEGET